MSVTDDRIQELNRHFLEFMAKPENVEAATKEIYEDLLDEVLMGFVFDVHRMTKTGSSDVEEGIPDDESYAIVGKESSLIFYSEDVAFFINSSQDYFPVYGKLCLCVCVTLFLAYLLLSDSEAYFSTYIAI